MKSLESKILRFADWSQPWTFKQSIERTMNEDELNLFKEIWLRAGSDKIWNYSELALGCMACRKFLQSNYRLSDEAISSVVRGLSYQWK